MNIDEIQAVIDKLNETNKELDKVGVNFQDIITFVSSVLHYCNDNEMEIQYSDETNISHNRRLRKWKIIKKDETRTLIYE